MPIKPPSDPDAQIECEFQLEPAFQKLAADAEAGGWDASIVARALKSLATNHMLSRTANAETDRRIVAGMSPRAIDARIMQSRRLLASVNRAYKGDAEGQLGAEIGVLRDMLKTAPEQKQEKIRMLIQKYEAALNRPP